VEHVWLTSALWIGLALVAALISIRIAVSVALIEIVVGGARRQPARLGAQRIDQPPGRARRHPADVPRRRRNRDLAIVRKHFSATMAIGAIGFPRPVPRVPCLRALRSRLALAAAQIAGIALSTTSVAVVYAVTVETDLNRTEGPNGPSGSGMVPDPASQSGRRS
jgi:hypothetical protein